MTTEIYIIKYNKLHINVIRLYYSDRSFCWVHINGLQGFDKRANVSIYDSNNHHRLPS